MDKPPDVPGTASRHTRALISLELMMDDGTEHLQRTAILVRIVSLNHMLYAMISYVCVCACVFSFRRSPHKATQMIAPRLHAQLIRWHVGTATARCQPKTLCGKATGYTYTGTHAHRGTHTHTITLARIWTAILIKSGNRRSRPPQARVR